MAVSPPGTCHSAGRDPRLSSQRRMPSSEGRMIRTSPFHERTSALNETGLWSHWSGHLAADRYQMSDKY
jgi:hypothetical protein